MQDYVDFAEKNGFTLLDQGACQCCGARTSRGIHECVEIFNLGFQEMDFSDPNNHLFRFLIVDAHALQHPEIHGRWSNHFHLSRLHLIFSYRVKWTYRHSPKLSDYLNTYKAGNPDEYLQPLELLKRGSITTTDVREQATDEVAATQIIRAWALDVYNQWAGSQEVVDEIAKGYLNQM